MNGVNKSMKPCRETFQNLKKFKLVQSQNQILKKKNYASILRANKAYKKKTKTKTKKQKQENKTQMGN